MTPKAVCRALLFVFRFPSLACLSIPSLSLSLSPHYDRYTPCILYQRQEYVRYNEDTPLTNPDWPRVLLLEGVYYRAIAGRLPRRLLW